jgi:hypothetical protein
VRRIVASCVIASSAVVCGTPDLGPRRSLDFLEHRTGLIRVLRMDGVQDMQDYSSPIHEIHDCVDRFARAAVGRYAGNEERR